MDIALDPSSHDLLLTTDLSLVTGVDAIKQHLKIRLWLFQGELFYDTSRGVPYYQDVLVKLPNLQIIESIFQDVILETPGVLSIDTMDLSWDRSLRLLSVSFDASVIGGTVDYTNLPLAA